MLHTPVPANKMELHSTTRNTPYIHPSHDSILELWRTFLDVVYHGLSTCTGDNPLVKVCRLSPHTGRQTMDLQL